MTAVRARTSIAQAPKVETDRSNQTDGVESPSELTTHEVGSESSSDEAAEATNTDAVAPSRETREAAALRHTADTHAVDRARELQLRLEGEQRLREPPHWDPRLSDPTLDPPVNASFEPAAVDPGQSYLQASSVRYEDASESGGRHHIFVRAPEGADVYALDYHGQRIDLEEKFEGGERFFEMPMWGGNTYSIHAEGVAGGPLEGATSDSVHGLHMPSNHHVVYRVDFTQAEEAWNSSAPVQPAVAPSPVAPAAAAPVVGAISPATIPHVVMPGDSLHKIADTHGVPYDDLLAANPAFEPRGSRRPNLLMLGEIIQVPQPRLAADAEVTLPMVAVDPVAAVTSPEALAVDPVLGEAMVPLGSSAPSAPAAAPASPAMPRTPGAFISANYTDLGRTDEGMPDPYSPGFRARVAEDLDRLAATGVDSVRIWASPAASHLSGPEAMGQRVRVIGEEAAARNMNVVVDLVDAAYEGGVDAYRTGAVAHELDARIPAVVGASRHLDNIDWSIGNELKDPHDPIAFAHWYRERADQVRQVSGNPAQGIVAELTPGAVGHPDHGWPQAREAMRLIAEASTQLDIHFYPVAAPGALPGPLPNGTHPAADWDSLRAWKAIADETGTEFGVGEFSIPRDGTAARGDEYLDLNRQWLAELRGLGAQHVRFWQLTKDEVGHIDPASVDRRGLHDAGVDEGRFAELLRTQ